MAALVRGDVAYYFSRLVRALGVFWARSAIMGHSDPRSVEKYAKVQGKAIRSALAKLEHTGGTGGTLEER